MSEKLRIVCPGCGRVYVEVEASDNAPRTMTERERQLLHAERVGLYALSQADGKGDTAPALAIKTLKRALGNYTGDAGGES